MHVFKNLTLPLNPFDSRNENRTPIIGLEKKERQDKSH